MAITTAGFTGTVNELQWAQLMEMAMGGNAAQVVTSGLDPTTGGVTRLVAVAAGTGAAAGVLFTNTASATIALNANASSNNRLDYVVYAIDWAADTVTLAKVTGTTGSVIPVAPALTQTAGVLWHVPVALVTVKPSITTFGSADIADVRPLRPSLKVFTPAVTATSVGQAAAPKTIASRTVADPGWPYRIRVSGAVEFIAVSAGYGNLQVTLDGVAFTEGRAPAGNAGRGVIRTETSAVLTGSHDVVLTMVAQGMSTALNSQSAGSGFTIEVVPA